MEYNWKTFQSKTDVKKYYCKNDGVVQITKDGCPFCKHGVNEIKMDDEKSSSIIGQ